MYSAQDIAGAATDSYILLGMAEKEANMIRALTMALLLFAVVPASALENTDTPAQAFAKAFEHWRLYIPPEERFVIVPMNNDDGIGVAVDITDGYERGLAQLNRAEREFMKTTNITPNEIENGHIKEFNVARARLAAMCDKWEVAKKLAVVDKVNAYISSQDQNAHSGVGAASEPSPTLNQ